MFPPYAERLTPFFQNALDGVQKVINVPRGIEGSEAYPYRSVLGGTELFVSDILMSGENYTIEETKDESGSSVGTVIMRALDLFK